MVTYTLRPKDLQGIENRAKYDLREDKVREQHLHKIARMVCNRDVTTKLGGQSISFKEGRSHYIIVSNKKVDQLVTDLEPETWDLLKQETTLFHEVGHVLWTDFEYLQEVLEHHEHADAIRRVFNGLEDGCIEYYLTLLYNISEDLIVTNANLVENIYQNREKFSPVDSLSFALQDHGFYDSGLWESMKGGEFEVLHVDKVIEMEDEIKDAMQTALRTQDCRERIDISVELTEKLIDKLPDEDEHTEPQHGDNQNESRNIGGKDEMTESSGGQVRNPKVEPDNQEDENKSQDNGEESQGENDDEGQGSDSGKSEQGPDFSKEDVEEAVGSVEEEYKPKAQQQSKKKRIEENKDNSSLKEHLIQMASGSNLGKEIKIPEWDRGRGGIKDCRISKTRGQNLEQILMAKLQNERSSSRRYGVSEGRLSSSELPYAVSGNSNVYYDDQQPEDKSYSVQLILDRSGSMGTSSVMRPAQRATMMLAIALYNVGVDVSILSFYNNDPYLELPFGEDPENCEDQLFSNESDGGTPLGDVAEMAHEHVTNGEFDEYFMIFIGDGKPGSSQQEKYKRVLRKSDYPIYGVYLGNEGKHKHLFDHITYANKNNIELKCKELCEGMIG